MAVRAAGGQLHHNGRVPVPQLGKLGAAGLGVLLLHHADHDRVRRLRARAEEQERRRGHQDAAHMVLFAVPVVRHRLAGHELQPSPGGGHQQREDGGSTLGHHQRRGRGGVRLRDAPATDATVLLTTVCYFC